MNTPMIQVDSILKFAAIDIGSNAVRLLLAGVIENGSETVFQKTSLIRMPVRLGYEAFTNGKLSKAKQDQLLKTIIGFKHLLDAYQPLDTMACATAALRKADNGAQIADRIRRKTGIRIDIIDGKREARILLENNRSTLPAGGDRQLFIDVGGGSTEISFVGQGRIRRSASFPIGTLSLLQDLVPARDWQRLQQWLGMHAAERPLTAAIGSGGNINKIFRLANGKKEKPLSYRRINEIKRMLEGLTVDQRITRLGLRPDRADVIVPAAHIYLKVMLWAGIRKMYVPMLGLADGMIHLLYRKYRSGGMPRPHSDS